jgi:hypothetical protein
MLDSAYATRFDRLGSMTGSVVNYVNVLGKRAGQASEPIKFPYYLPSIACYTSNTLNYNIRVLVLQTTYPSIIVQ